MLRDELKTNIEPLSLAANPLRDEIEQQTQAFLAAGGKIGGYEKPPVFKGHRELGDMSNIDIVNVKNRAKARAKSGHQNITKIKTGYSVTVGYFHCGTVPTVDEAITLRDKHRAANSMPPADY
jgi:hypothetical protein